MIAPTSPNANSRAAPLHTSRPRATARPTPTPTPRAPALVALLSCALGVLVAPAAAAAAAPAAAAAIADETEPAPTPTPMPMPSPDRPTDAAQSPAAVPDRARPDQSDFKPRGGRPLDPTADADARARDATTRSPRPAAAQTPTRNSGSIVQVVLAALGLAGIAILGYIVFAWLRRRILADDEPSDGGAFTLAGLRRMHAEGQLTDEEFHAAKAAIIGHVRRPTSRETPRQSTPGPPGERAPLRRPDSPISRTPSSSNAQPPSDRHRPASDEAETSARGRPIDPNTAERADRTDDATDDDPADGEAPGSRRED